MLGEVAFAKQKSITFFEGPLDKELENNLALVPIDCRHNNHTIEIEFFDKDINQLLDKINIYIKEKNRSRLLTTIDIKNLSRGKVEFNLGQVRLKNRTSFLLTALLASRPKYEIPFSFKLNYNGLSGTSPLYLIGYALRRAGDDNSKCYRIPALGVTNRGTLIAVYDVRYDGQVDLPNHIDVGMSRSIDKGQSWQPMKIIMDMGNDPAFKGEGIGDPAILIDSISGRIWVAALWSHGDNAWNKSGKGLEPEETGQLMLVYSDDDGENWSAPINITKMVKKPEYHLFFQAPGCGITMKDGTLVFAAQYRDESDKKTPFSTIIYSKDGGKSWKAGNGVRANTTESQVVELEDGILMINCRDDLNKMDKKRKVAGGRAIYISKDLGESWEKHSSSDWTLPEPNCQASLIKLDDSNLLFFNPNTHKDIGADQKGGGRRNYTLQLSRDLGKSWSKKIKFDDGYGRGYSSMAVLDECLCIIYEGSKSDIFFQKILISEVLK